MILLMLECSSIPVDHYFPLEVKVLAIFRKNSCFTKSNKIYIAWSCKTRVFSQIRPCSSSLEQEGCIMFKSYPIFAVTDEAAVSCHLSYSSLSIRHLSIRSALSWNCLFLPPPPTSDFLPDLPTDGHIADTFI